jgi:lipopolysaccharide transport system permease protein
MSHATLEVESPLDLTSERRALPPDDLPVTIVERQPGWKFVDVAEVWRYRELLYFLVWRDVKIRYKQTVLGAAWAILQPFATMVVFSLFFGRLAQMSASDVPYSLFVFAGLLPWTFFAGAIANAGNSIVGSQNLVTKVYFPRIFIPLSAVGAGLVDFAIAFGMLLVLMLYYGVMPGVGMICVPLLALLLVMAAAGVGTILSALTVAYRDFRYVVPFMVQLWMFATPCIYMSEAGFESSLWRLVLPLNPVYGIILAFRAAALGGAWDLGSLAISSGVTLVCLLAGCVYFRRVERSFADII